ncbi:MAG: hypothetical protein ACRC8P_00890 [Spiroplasma sp.]
MYLVDLENSLSKKLGTKVQIKNKKLIINYSTIEDLNHLLEVLKLID